MMRKYVYIIIGVLIGLSCPAMAQGIHEASSSSQPTDSLVQVIDSLKQTVTALSGEIKENKENERLQEVWGKHRKYMNIGYVSQSLTRKENGGGTWKSEIGFNYGQGRTYYLHKKPILGMIKFGIDWTFYDLNFVKYKDKFGVFGGNADYLGYGDYYYEDGYLPPLPDTEGDEEVFDDMMQMEISTQVGPSVTINPVNHLKVSGYFRVAPSYSMLVASEELYHGYGTFFTLGGSVSFKIISIGIEGRWGNTKYNNIDLGNLEDEEYWDEDASMGDMLKGENDKIKWKTGSMRFYISFRLGK